VLGRRFDRERDVEVVQTRPHVDVFEHGPALLRGHPAAFDVAVEQLRDPVEPALDATLVDVVEQHLVPVLRKHLRDAGPHLPRSDD